MDMVSRVERRLRLQSLQTLMTVIKKGSMRKAAASLNTTQPSVSRAIAELEETIGMPLLDRNPQGVEPTACGRALLDGGIAIFDELRQAVRNIEFLADPTSGEVRIGSVPAFAASFVTAVIDRFSQRYPRVRFHVVTGLAEALHQQLMDRRIDLTITAKFDRLASDRVDFQFLFDGSFVVAAGAESPWARRRKLALADLANEPWTLPSPDSSLGSIFLQAFRASGLDYPRVAVIADPIDVRIGLLTTGRFLTIFDPTVLRFAIKRHAVVALPIGLRVTPAPIGISTLNARTLSPVTKLFINYARDIARPLSRKTI